MNIYFVELRTPGSGYVILRKYPQQCVVLWGGQILYFLKYQYSNSRIRQCESKTDRIARKSTRILVIDEYFNTLLSETKDPPDRKSVRLNLIAPSINWI